MVGRRGNDHLEVSMNRTTHRSILATGIVLSATSALGVASAVAASPGGDAATTQATDSDRAPRAVLCRVAPGSTEAITLNVPGRWEGRRSQNGLCSWTSPDGRQSVRLDFDARSMVRDRNEMSDAEGYRERRWNRTRWVSAGARAWGYSTNRDPGRVHYLAVQSPPARPHATRLDYISSRGAGFHPQVFRQARTSAAWVA